MSATAASAARRGWAPPWRWLLTNFGILYGITFAAGCVTVSAALIADSSESVRWAWLGWIPAWGLFGIGFTIFFTFPAFALYLIGLRLALRRWPRRLTAWLLTPLLTWAVLWTWPAGGEGSWWAFGLALACVAAAASLVRL